MSTSNNVLLTSIQAMLGNKESARAVVSDRLTHEAFVLLRDGNSHHIRETLDTLATAKGNGKVLSGYFSALVSSLTKKRQTTYKTLKKADLTPDVEKAINAFIAKGIATLWTGYDSELNAKKEKAATTRAANKAAKDAPTESATDTASADTAKEATPLHNQVTTASLPKGWNARVNKASQVTGFEINGFYVSIKSMADHAKSMQKALEAVEMPAKEQKTA